MRTVLVVALFASIAPATILASPQVRPGTEGLPPIGPPAGWPAAHPVPQFPVSVNAQAPALPRPSITEPFSIGEALHDPSRVADAVVSVLALMGIETIPDDPEVVVIGGPTLRLQESEVRALIEMGKEDAEAQRSDPSGPYTFTRLHETMQRFLPGMSVEDLAAAYTEEYERNPDGIVGQVLMGQPLDPDTPLLRTELWLLFADRLVAQRATAAAMRGPRIVRVQQRFSFRNLPDHSGYETALRLPGILQAALAMGRARGHEGHGGPGQTMTLEGFVRGRAIRFNVIPPRPPLLPVTTTLAGMQASWTTDDTIRKHAPSAPASSRSTVGAGGVARLSFTLRPEAARGRGADMTEPGTATLTVDMEELCARLYGGNLGCAELSGSVSERAIADLEWHAADVIEARITNLYDVGSKAAAFALSRNGVDNAVIKLARDDDGTYRGGGELMMLSTTSMPGRSCGTTWGRQTATVIGVPIARDVAAAGSRQVGGTDLSMGAAFYGAVHMPPHYLLKRTGQPDSQLPPQPLYLRLEFFPETDPLYRVQDAAGCQEEIPGPTSRATPKFLPLNDAQWTVEGFYGRGTDTNRAGYSIAVPETGELTYEDHTSDNSMKVGSVDLSALLQAKSVWYLTVTRRKVSP